MSDSTTKTCSACGIEYPANPEFFYVDKSAKSGLTSKCRWCQRLYNHVYQEEHREKVREYNRLSRIKHRDEALERGRIYRNQNRERLREKSKLYYFDNHERVKERQRHYYILNAERIRKRHKRYYISNVEKNREREREYRAKYPSRLRIKSHNRRAKKRDLPNTFTDQDWKRALDYFGGCCAVCGKPQGLWHVIAQEHWIAIDDLRADNPGTVPSNVLPMCHSMKDGRDGCNNTKWKLDPVVWLNRKFGQRKAAQIAKRIEEYFQWVTTQTD